MKNYRHHIGGTIAGLLLSVSCAAAHAETDVSLDAGLRTDYLRWNIADPYYQPNILSELTWRNIHSQYISARVTYKSGDFNLLGNYGYGKITRGDNQDSDYDGNNRTMEFSRSNNNSNGDHVSDAKIGVGIDFERLKGVGFQFTPWVGLSQHTQSLRMTNGFQTIPTYAPVYGPFPGLNSTYEAQWGIGPWVGLDGVFKLNDQFIVRAALEYHVADYYAKANWNLIPCFEHPKSYDHNASGNGKNFSLGAEYVMSTELSVTLTAIYGSWSTGSGSDHIFLSPDFYTAPNPRNPGHLLCESYGATINEPNKVFDVFEPLNEVKWHTTSVLLGLKQRL